MLLFDLQRIRRRTRKPHRHVAAEMKGPVIPPAEFDRLDGKICPVGELRSDQPAYERYVDIHRTGVHVPGWIGNTTSFAPINPALFELHPSMAPDCRRGRFRRDYCPVAGAVGVWVA